MEGSSAAVLALVERARRRLLAAAFLDAVTAPAAAFLLLAAAVLAVARAGGRSDLPAGFLAAGGLLAALAAGARLVRNLPGPGAAALHLDRALGARERFTTVLEALPLDPAVAAWAARRALRDAGEGAVRRALALEPPAGLLPLLLAGTLAAGLVLLPAPAPDAPPPAAPAAAAGGAAAGGASGPARPGAGAAPLPDARAAAADAAARRVGGASREEDALGVVADLEARARAAKAEGALLDLAAAREALARGDREGAAAAVRRAVEGIYGPGAAPPEGPGEGGTGRGGADGSGEAAAGDPGGRVAPALRPFPVPLRAREAVRRYFGDRDGEER